MNAFVVVPKYFEKTNDLTLVIIYPGSDHALKIT